MKKIIVLVLLLASFESISQVKQKPVSYGVQYNRVQADSGMRIPTVQVGIKDFRAGFDTAQIRYNKTDSTVETYTGSQWIPLRGAGGGGSGTVTNVSALTLGTTGTDLSSSVANSTTTPVITLNVPTASASNRGALSAADWITFNSKGSGTVTSVSGLTPLFTVANATTTPTFSLISQNQNLVYASPNGSSGVPSFRALVAGDLPGGGWNNIYTSDGTITGNRTVTGNNKNLFFYEHKGLEFSSFQPGNYIYMATYDALGQAKAVVIQDSATWRSDVADNTATFTSYINQKYNLIELEITGGPGDINLEAASGSSTINLETPVINIGGLSTATETRYLEPSGSGINYSAFKAVAQAGNITYSLPPSLTVGGVWTDVAGNGVLTSVTPSTVATAVPLSGITAAVGANTIANGNNKQTWQWDLLTAGAIALSSNSTTAAGNLQKLLHLLLQGVNANASQTTYSLQSQNLHSGTGSVNIAGLFEAINGDVNYAIIVPASSGSVGIGTSTPSATLDLVGTFQYVDGNQSNGFVLTTDANGNATWQAAGGSQALANTSDATSHTVTLTGGTSVQLVEGSNITLTTTGTGANGVLTIASTAGGGDVTKVGTPVNNQVGVWTGDGTIEGDADLTFDGTSLSVGASVNVASSTTEGIKFGGNLIMRDAGSNLRFMPSAGVTQFIDGVNNEQLYIYNGSGGGNALIGATGGVSFNIETQAGLTNMLMQTSAGHNLMVGNAVPTSKLHVAGSFAAAYVAKSANYTLDITDYTVECTANTFTVTLPTSVGITGRIYNVVNSGAGVITIATTSSQTFVNVVATPTTLTLSAVGTYQLQSNGANWLVLSVN